MGRCLIIFWVMLCFAGSVSAQAINQTEPLDVKSGTAIEFIEGEFILAEGIDMPASGWTVGPSPNIDLRNKTDLPTGEYRTMAGRFHFDRKSIGTDPSAIYMIGTRDNFTVSINGDEVFRNFANISDPKNPWYRPYLIPVPDQVLNAGENEIVIHAFSRHQVGIGRIAIGSSAGLHTYYKSHFFWHIQAPMITNYTMLLLGLLVFIFWVARKQEIELLWISIANILWFIRNQIYFFEETPFNPAFYSIYSAVSVHASYFAAVATTAFYLHFIKLRNRKIIIASIFILGIPILLARIWTPFSSYVIYVAGTLVISFVGIIALRDIYRNRKIERIVLGLGMVLLPFASFHDLVDLLLYSGDGHATYLVVFGGFFYAIVFLLYFGMRILTAFTDLEKSNVILEQSIAKTREDLAESEAIRRNLVIAQAVTTERGRLMQEMHDGIGSNLTTALAVARQQNQPSTTIKVLRRALGDLKLTVDSLEPVEGDLVALIGNLRHRMARDLADAGITCKWEVEDCAPIAWLDATNALHVLRIHNEAISNVLSHSNATEIRIGCVEAEHEGVPGVSTYIADNGKGIDKNSETQGRGLANMRSRAYSLHGQLFCEPQPGGGTRIRLWLPYQREDHSNK